MHVLAALSVALGLLLGTMPAGPSYQCSVDGTVHATCCCADSASGSCCGEDGEPAPCAPHDAAAKGPCCVVVPPSAQVDPTLAEAGAPPVLPIQVADSLTLVVDLPMLARLALSLQWTSRVAGRETPLYVLHESFLI